MELPITRRRIDIASMIHRGNYELLKERFGIVLLQEASFLYDCGLYVLNSLNIPANDRTITRLHELRGQGDPQAGIVMYRDKGAQRIINHFGLYKDGKVVSKWNAGPLFEHDIADVPGVYGKVAEFKRIDTALPFFYEALQEKLFQMDMGY